MMENPYLCTFVYETKIILKRHGFKKEQGGVNWRFCREEKNESYDLIIYNSQSKR